MSCLNGVATFRGEHQCLRRKRINCKHRDMLPDNRNGCEYRDKNGNI